MAQLLSGSQEVCGVCINWTGDRELDTRTKFMHVNESQGRCVCRGYGSSNQYWYNNLCKEGEFTKCPGILY